jgi:hypothetical protein
LLRWTLETAIDLANTENYTFTWPTGGIGFFPPVDILVPGGGFNIEIEMGLGGRATHYELGVTELIIGAPIGYPIP